MNTYKQLQFFLLSMLACSTAFANPYYSGNPYSAIPPGCVTNLSTQWSLYGDNFAEVWRGEVLLNSALKPLSMDPKDLLRAKLSVLRVACAEPGRSAIVLWFWVPEDVYQYGKSNYVLPWFAAETEGNVLALVPLSEPTDWYEWEPGKGQPQKVFGNYTDGWYDIHYYAWAYILDSWSPSEPPGGFDYTVPADVYNNAFTLLISPRGMEPMRIPIPRTSAVLQQNPVYPLNGRLSGNWVVEGARDQGLILSFANRVPPAGKAGTDAANPDLLLFLSWYTFDAAGDMLWLTGVASLPLGASSVTVPIEHVTAGGFLGGRSAARSNAGQVTLSASNCNDLRLDYQLTDLGLGSGSRQLRRLQSLEIAGYPCRDYMARRDAIKTHTTP